MEIFLILVEIYCLFITSFMLLGAIISFNDNPRAWWLMYALTPVVFYFIGVLTNR